MRCNCERRLHLAEWCRQGIFNDNQAQV